MDDMPCYTWGYTSHKPQLSMWHCNGVIKEKEYPLIGDYKIWLNFFCDYIGYDVSIYYPIDPIQEDKIKVIFIGAKIQKRINWIHGKEGLFGEIILPLLFLEKNCKHTLYENEQGEMFCPLCNPPF